MNTSTSNIQNINSFFETFAQALESHNAKTMAFLHQMPTTMLSDDAYTVFTDASKLEGFFNQGIVFYRQMGIVYTKAEVWCKMDFTGRIARAKVCWIYTDALHQPVYECDYHYVLKLDKNNHWRIILTVSVNEKERMEEWKKKDK
jgi:hypothetical protein